MAYNTQSRWFTGLRLSHGILNNYKTQRFGKCICFRHQVRGETSALLGTIERANLDH
jgi:hypothetical protein